MLTLESMNVALCKEYVEVVESLKQENKTEFERYQISLAVRDKEIEETKQLNDSFAREIKRLRNKNNDLIKKVASETILGFE